VTRVFIADDHAFVRGGVGQALRDMGGFEIAAEAADGRKVLNAPDSHRWDVLVLDLSLPKVSGIEVLRRIRARHPDLPIVVLSMFPEKPHARHVLAAGASAYVSKSRPPADLVAAVRTAVRGQRCPPAPEDDEEPPHATLTRREHQILMLLVEGRAVCDIAAELDVHSCTVSNHLAKVRQKLGVGSVAELVRHAWSAGLVEEGPRVASAGPDTNNCLALHGWVAVPVAPSTIAMARSPLRGRPAIGRSAGGRPGGNDDDQR
jgi:DNA-binding NarL/FixJ family response regulator